MKNKRHTYQLIYFFLLLSYAVVAQSGTRIKTLREVYYLKGYTASGSVVFGIYPDSIQAVQMAKKYRKTNRNDAERLTYKKIVPGAIPIAEGQTIFKMFAIACPKGYKRISRTQYNVLRILYNDTMEAALWYYRETEKISQQQALKDVTDLCHIYKKYLVD